MLKVSGGRFPQNMHGVLPLPLVKWASDETQAKAVNAPFSIVLSEDDTLWSITYQDAATSDWRTLGGETSLLEENGGIRCDSKEMLDFWMVLRRV